MVIAWNAAIVLQWFENMSYTGDFDPVAGFPPVGLSLVVLRSWLVLQVFSVVNAVKNQGGCSFGSFQQWRFHVVVDCSNIRRRFDELLPGGWAPRLTLLLSGFSVLYKYNDIKQKEKEKEQKISREFNSRRLRKLLFSSCMMLETFTKRL